LNYYANSLACDSKSGYKRFAKYHPFFVLWIARNGRCRCHFLVCHSPFAIANTRLKEMPELPNAPLGVISIRNT
jgi:hypothetical protein